MIPNARPSIGDDELLEIKKVLDSGWLGMGSTVFEFETRLKEWLGARNAIAVNTGTSALHIALDASGIGRQDEVIVPSLTFAGTIQAIIACGAAPVFCEVESDTLNIDLADVEKKVTGRTKAVMPVHYGGQPCDIDGLLSLADKFKLRVIEDAAHAFGSLYKGRKIGSLGGITCFSFDPIKNITCGEGGAVVTDDDKFAQIVVKKRILGIDKDTWHRYKNQRSWFYEVVVPGFRYHMSNINAAIGLVQLKKIEAFLENKRRIASIYDANLASLPEVTRLKRDYPSIAPFNYVVKIKEGRDLLLNYLKQKGIDAGIHYIPNHLQPLFKGFSGKLPITEKLYEQILTLPLYAGMREEDAAEVVAGVKGYYKERDGK